VLPVFNSYVSALCDFVLIGRGLEGRKKLKLPGKPFSGSFPERRQKLDLQPLTL